MDNKIEEELQILINNYTLIAVSDMTNEEPSDADIINAEMARRIVDDLKEVLDITRSYL